MGTVSAIAHQTPTLTSPLCAYNPAKVEATPLVSNPVDPPLVFATEQMNKKMKYKRSSVARCRSGTIPGTSPLRIMVFPEDTTDRKPIWDAPLRDKENSQAAIDAGQIHHSIKDTSRRFYPLLDSTSRSDMELTNRPCAAHSAESMKCLAHSDAEDSPSELSSLQTLKFDRLDGVDIGMLGLDRFRWPEESEDFIHSHCFNIKSDSVALTSYCEDGQWVEERYQYSGIGTTW